jgi:hypothetical protein
MVLDLSSSFGPSAPVGPSTRLICFESVEGIPASRTLERVTAALETEGIELFIGEPITSHGGMLNRKAG